MWALMIWSGPVEPRKAVEGLVHRNATSMTSEPAPRIKRLPMGTTRTPGSALRVSKGAMIELPRLTPSTKTMPSSGGTKPRPASVTIKSTAAIEEWNSQVTMAASR
ncbi:hypothetical protein D9M70_613340 [compost metagenome]